MTEKELVAKMLDTLEKSRKELANIDLGITKKSLPDLDKIIEHISAPLMIMVMGEFSTGKSTFINAMVGEEVTAVNATPTTAVITKLCYGNQDKILVHFTDGTEKEYKKTAFKRLTSKTGKKNEDKTHAKIEYVERQLPLDMLQYVTIIDSPGLNDINERHSDTTKKFVNNADTVFWMFNALHAGSKTEVDAMEALTPRLKPIAIINMMDEIDEEEDDPQEFLDNLRVQLKDKVQAVVGISAKYALEGKLEKNETKAEIGNLKELEQVVRELVLPNRDKFKLNTLMDELGEWLGSFNVNDLEEVNLKNKEIDYEAYLELKAKIQQNKEILGRIICDDFKKYIFNASRIFNEQAMFILGELYEDGITVTKDISQAEQYYEDAAIKNHVLAQAALGGIYYSAKKDFKKAVYWLEKAASQNSKIALALLGIIYLTDETTGEVDLQNADLEKALPLLEKAAALDESYSLLMLSGLYFDGIGVIKDEKKACNFLFRSAKLGNESALLRAGEFFLSFYEDDDENDDEDENKDNIIKAIDCFTQAAEYGDAEALFNLGEISRKYWNGEDRNEKSLKYYKKAALLGNADAQYWLALYYRNGIGLEKDDAQALVWLQKSSEQENAKAQNMLGRCYQEGWGVEKDSVKAIEWFKKAAAQGYAIAMSNLAFHYDSGEGVGQDYKEAIKWFEKAAEQDNSTALYMLGMYYHYGLGIEKDEEQSFKYYLKAAELGDASAQFEVATCFESGTGTKRNPVQAFQWYQKAAEQGSDKAQYRVGYCYETGWGTEVNADKAMYWYQKAAEQGQGNAKERIAILEQRLKGHNAIKSENERKEKQKHNVTAAKNLADEKKIKLFNNYKRQAENGDKFSQYELGNCYKDGIGTEIDTTLAVYWYMKAAEQGHESARYMLSLLRGKDTRKDSENELKEKPADSMQNKESYFESCKRAADTGDKRAQYELALLYAAGTDVRKDNALAFYWCRKSADQGYSLAQYALATYYEKGIGVSVNTNQAIYFYKKAAEQGYKKAEFELNRLRNAKDNKQQTSNNGQTTQTNAPQATFGVRQATRPKSQNAKLHSTTHVAKNEDKSYFKECENRAESGDVIKQYELAVCYATGEGVTKNPDLAFYWYQKSAYQGYVYAQYALATCYLKGTGTDKNITNAKYWYEKAAAQGYEKAKLELQRLSYSNVNNSERTANYNSKSSTYAQTRVTNSGNSSRFKSTFWGVVFGIFILIMLFAVPPVGLVLLIGCAYVAFKG